jgi:hypothetical protein
LCPLVSLLSFSGFAIVQYPFSFECPYHPFSPLQMAVCKRAVTSFSTFHRSTTLGQWNCRHAANPQFMHMFLFESTCLWISKTAAIRIPLTQQQDAS